MTAPSAKLIDIPQASRVSVVLPLPLSAAYDYVLPAPFLALPGNFVEVPLGGRSVVGVVWDCPSDARIETNRLKPVRAVLPAPPMSASLRRFIDWVAAYTLSPTGAVLRMAMSAPSALEAPGHRAGWRLGVAQGQRVTPERARLENQRINKWLAMLRDWDALVSTPRGRAQV